MSSNDQAIEQFCAYFLREADEIERLAAPHTDGNREPSAASGPLYRKVLYITMLDTLAGIRFDKKRYPDLFKGNRARFTRFVKDHCHWTDAELVSLPFLLDKLKEQNLENRPLGQYVSNKVAQFSTDDGGLLDVSAIDEHTSVLLRHAASEKEESSIWEYQHIALLYRYRNRLVHESREPGNAMDLFDRSAPYYHGYLGDPRWHLAYPLSMFKELLCDGLSSFQSYLVENSLNPYLVLDNTERW
jgi:hypothetical protein